MDSIGSVDTPTLSHRLKYNLPFFISALFWLAAALLSSITVASVPVSSYDGYVVSYIYGAMCWGVLFLYAPILWSYLISLRKIIWCISIFTTVGVSIGWIHIMSILDRTMWLGVVVTIGSMPIVFAVLALFYNWLWVTFREALGKRTLVVCLILAAGWTVLCVISLRNTRMMYGTNCPFDIIYTFDIGAILMEHVWIVPDVWENNAVQPFFGLFAMPFAGIPCFADFLFGCGSAGMYAAYIGIQAVLLMLSYGLLADAAGLEYRGKLWFLLFASCAFPCALFLASVEQYVVSFFYLSLLVHRMAKHKRDKALAAGLAWGCMLPAGMLSLFDCKHWKELPRRFGKGVFIYVFVFLAAGRMANWLYVLSDSLSRLSFSSLFVSVVENESVFQRILESVRQYFVMMQSCFLCPDSDWAVRDVLMGGSRIAPQWSLQMPAADHISWMGVLAIVLFFVSLYLFRSKSYNRISGIWFLIGIISICFCGYGADENGMVIYTLYWGWPVLLGIFCLGHHIANKFGKYALPIGTAAACIAMLAYNVPRILEIIRAGAVCWPVV